VVIGIIGVMIAMLMPTLNKAQAQAQKIKCMSNLHQIGQDMLIYADSNKGYLFPPNKGWPAAPNVPPFIAGTNPPQYDVWPWYVLGSWNNPILICPSDLEPSGQHSYFVNAYLMAKSMDNISVLDPAANRDMQYSTEIPNGPSPSDIIVMGEKLSMNPQGLPVNDYYMEPGDFDTKVSQYRHGVYVGSNYLMLDMHVDSLLPGPATTGMDPWDPNGLPTTQQ